MRNKRILKKLALGLLKIKEEKFSIREWRNTSGCGTVCCAIGWMPKICPEVKKKGFIISRTYNVPQFDTKRKNFRYVYGWNAISEFFSINFNDAIYLFNYPSYPNATRTTKQQVSDRILKFLKDTK